MIVSLEDVRGWDLKISKDFYLESSRYIIEGVDTLKLRLVGSSD